MSNAIASKLKVRVFSLERSQYPYYYQKRIHKGRVREGNKEGGEEFTSITSSPPCPRVMFISRSLFSNPYYHNVYS
ncbi:hypothetical protein QUB80_31400 [Chlorogloeopsis sp. ULAP01]|uniref:hypothetical protein n=1 Tax=Chlorogloeopsis sp. ULAP01 TaxID=3056483 RepID=UPI0025AA9232|nr:hypothetical protein [Chlorogloeopsis sp. ULAP01]MDM9385163.1 hypothetical protein [Chlorogloeopsis sp. ULAP01]